MAERKMYFPKTCFWLIYYEVTFLLLVQLPLMVAECSSSFSLMSCSAQRTIYSSLHKKVEKNPRKFCYIELNSEKYAWIIQPNGQKYGAAGMLEILLPSAVSKTSAFEAHVTLPYFIQNKPPSTTLSLNEMEEKLRH